MWEYAVGPPVLQHERQNWFVNAVRYTGSEQELHAKSRTEWKLQGKYSRLTLLKET